MADEKDYLGYDERLDRLEAVIEKTVNNVNELISISKKLLEIIMLEKGEKDG